MNILDSIARRIGYTKTQPIPSPVSWQLAQARDEQYSMPVLDIPQKQSELYQRLTWVQIAVSAVASVAASTVLSVKQLTGEDESDIPNHPFELLLDRPNPLQSRFEFLESIFSYRALTGNSYVWLNRRNENMPPTEMWIIPPYSIKPVPDDKMYLRGYIYEPQAGQQIPLELYEVVHFKKFHPLNAFVGLSPVEALATVAVGDMAMSRWNTNFFDKDNAKVPGILAFADPIGDSDWAQLKQDVTDQHGGTKRRMMMLRNAGKGGVEWVATAMAQADMQFLEARNANKEEIYSMFAPGLSSILAVNATEANALAGKRTFVEMSVWPQLMAVAEKITNDILPSYGPNLRAEFDDIRITDRALELQEQAAYSQVATIDEIRQKFYQLDPIGDERGEMLPVQIGQGSAPSEPVADEPDPMPIPSQLQGFAGQDNAPDDGGPDTAPETDTDDSTQSADEMDAEKAAELGRFRRWAKKRKDPDPSAFKSSILSYEDKAAALWELTEEGDADDLPPFTHSHSKAAVPLDPDDDEAEQKARKDIERRAERIIASALKEQREAVLSAVQRDNSVSAAEQAVMEHSGTATDALRRALVDSADLGVNIAISQLETVGLGFDWTAPNTVARDWAQQYTYDLIRRINETTVRQVRQSVGNWITNGEALPALVRELTPTFGRRRAELIAATEVTRAYAEGNRQAYKESGVVTEWQWRTARDELVCPICGPLQGTTVRIDASFHGTLPEEIRQKVKQDFTAPPAHPNCRCWVVPVVRDIEEAAPVPEQAAAPKRIEYNGTTLDLSEGAAIRERLLAQSASREEEIARLHEQLRNDHPLQSRTDQLNELLYSATITEEQRKAVIAELEPLMEQMYKDVDDQWARVRKLQLERLTELQQAINAEGVKVETILGDDFKGVRGVTALRKKIDAAADFVGSISKQTVTTEVKRLSKSDGGRAYAWHSPITNANHIYIDVGTSQKTIVHEIGHNLEYERGAEYAAKRKAFYDYRTQNDEIEKLADLFPGHGYDDNEKTKKDKWLHAYMGKWYKRDLSSELISMGVEYLYSNPIELAKEDPEYFDFLLSWLQGKL